MSNILIIKLGSLGDLIQANGAIKDIKNFYKNRKVFLLTAEPYSIFMSEVENVGYKRTKRGENKKPNDLFRTNSSGEVIVDDGVKKTVLDHLREIEWD